MWFYYSLNIPLCLAPRNTVFYFSKCFKTGICFTAAVGIIFVHATSIYIVAHWVKTLSREKSLKSKIVDKCWLDKM